MTVEYVRVGNAVERRVSERCADCHQSFAVKRSTQRRCPQCQRAYVRTYNTEWKRRARDLTDASTIKPPQTDTD